MKVKIPKIKVKVKVPRIRVPRAKGGLFKPPRHKWLAEIVSFESPKAAQKAAKKLVKALERGRIGSRKIGRKTALTIARALQYAANRARAAARRSNLSLKEKRELKKIAEIYDKAADKAFEIYHKKYK